MLELAIEWSSSTLDASISSNTSVILIGSSRPSVSCSEMKPNFVEYSITIKDINYREIISIILFLH